MERLGGSVAFSHFIKVPPSWGEEEQVASASFSGCRSRDRVTRLSSEALEAAGAALEDTCLRVCVLSHRCGH